MGLIKNLIEQSPKFFLLKLLSRGFEEKNMKYEYTAQIMIAFRLDAKRAVQFPKLIWKKKWN